MRKIIASILAICTAAFLWAVEGIILTPRLFNLDVGFVVFIMHAITFAVLNIFLWKEYAKLKEFTKSDYAYLTLIALTGGVIGTMAIVKALFLVNFQHLSVVVLLQQLQPIFAILLAIFILKEKAKPRFYLWAAVALVAGYFLAFGIGLPDFQTGENTAYAAMLAVLAAMAWGSATVFGRKMATRHDFRTIAFHRAGFTTAIMFVYIIIFSRWDQFAAATPSNWAIATVIAISSGVLSMFLYYFGLKKVKAMVATICELAFPISAVVLDYVVNATILSPMQWLSAAVMVLSIMRIGRLQKD